MTSLTQERQPQSSERRFKLGDHGEGRFYSLPAFAEQTGLPISRLPVSLRIVLESLLRNCDGKAVTQANVQALASWKPNAPRSEEIPFIVARIIIPDSSGVPLLADLAAMRDAAKALGFDPGLIEPKVNVDLIIDHSAQVDFSGTPDALEKNLKLEFERNSERYAFLKWSRQAFSGVRVVPPGFGIIHQINLEYLSPGVQHKGDVFFPDTLVGADSHTPMINALGVVAWGVGGIEADAGMLGEPIYFLTPDVVGVRLKNSLRPGVTATDAVLTIVERLRAAKVVGAFIEYFGEGAGSLTATDRATISNMTPETGATIGFFPVDARTVDYYRSVGRSKEELATFESYYRAQGMWGMPAAGEIDYSSVIEIDLAEVEPSIAGPRRPQDRISLSKLPASMSELLTRPRENGGFGRPAAAARSTTGSSNDALRDGSVTLAAITSCTNTSNPALMIGAGLLAKNAATRGLAPPAFVKTSFSPGSRAVSSYLEQAGLQPYLDKLGFQPVGYGCMTCLGNSGPLRPMVEDKVANENLVVAAVLSGNRNFEARIHPAIRANFLMSPALVIAFALAGRMDIDFEHEPLGTDPSGAPVMLADIWPNQEVIDEELHRATSADLFRKVYEKIDEGDVLWRDLKGGSGKTFAWDDTSTYIKNPPFFQGFALQPQAPAAVTGARLLALFGDSLTTDHISPGGSIKKTSPAGEYLIAKGVGPADFNSYISRRGNHEVMMRGTFANVRIRNLLTPDDEGGVTIHQPSGDKVSIYDAAMRYADEKVPLVVIAGQEYGTGSSRDWAAKGTMLLGVRAVIAKSFERIHRSNLVGMGVLPCQFDADVDLAALKLTGRETFDILGTDAGVSANQKAVLRIHSGGQHRDVPVVIRIDTPIEEEYYRNGGILPYVMRSRLS
jgi:aconitate hydratase